MNRPRLFLLLAAPVLAVVVAGCSQPLHIGSAATVGSTRISEETVRTQVAQAVAVTGRAPTAALAREVLGNLINTRLVDDLAARYRIAPSAAAVRTELSGLITQAGSLSALRTEAAAGGVAPSQLLPTVRDIVIETDLDRRLAAGRKLSTAQQQQLLSAALVAEERAEHVDVSPRFGVFSDGQVIAAPSASLASPVPAPASTVPSPAG